MKIEKIKVIEVTIHEHHLDILYGADAFTFTTKIFYHNISFLELIQKYSAATINTIVSYITLVLNCVSPVKAHRISIYDDFIDYPLIGKN